MLQEILRQIPIDWHRDSAYDASVLDRLVSALASADSEKPKYSIGQRVCFAYPHMTGVKVGQGIVKGLNIHPRWDRFSHEWVGIVWAYKVDIFDTGFESITTGVTTLLETELIGGMTVVSMPKSDSIVGLEPFPGWLFGRIHLLEQEAAEIARRKEFQLEIPFYE
jgi:hypothetical protein